MKSMVMTLTLCLLALYGVSIEAGEPEQRNQLDKSEKALLDLHTLVTKGETPVDVDAWAKKHDVRKEWAAAVLMTVRMDRCVRSFFDEADRRKRLATEEVANLLGQEEGLKVVDFGSLLFGFPRQPFDAAPKDVSQWLLMLWGATGAKEFEGLVRVLHQPRNVVRQYKYVVRDDGKRSHICSLELDKTFEERAWRVQQQNVEVFAFWSRVLGDAEDGPPDVLKDVPGIGPRGCRLLLVENTSGKLAETRGAPVAHTLWFHSPLEADDSRVVAVAARMKRGGKDWRVTDVQADRARMAAAKQSQFLGALRKYARVDVFRSFSQPLRRAHVLENAKLARVKRCIRRFFEAGKQTRPRWGQPKACDALSEDGPFRFIELSSWIHPKPRHDLRRGNWADLAGLYPELWQQRLFSGSLLVENKEANRVEEYRYVVRDDDERSRVVSVDRDEDFDGRKWALDRQDSQVRRFWRKLLDQPDDARQKVLPVGGPEVAGKWTLGRYSPVDKTIAKTDGSSVTYEILLWREGADDKEEYKFLLAGMTRRGNTWQLTKLSSDPKSEREFMRQLKDDRARVALARKLLRVTGAELEALVLTKTDQVVEVLQRVHDHASRLTGHLEREEVAGLHQKRKFIPPFLKLLARDVRGPDTPPNEVPAVIALSLLGSWAKALVLEKFIQLSDKDEHWRALEKYCVQILLNMDQDNEILIPRSLRFRGEPAKSKRFRQIVENLKNSAEAAKKKDRPK